MDFLKKMLGTLVVSLSGEIIMWNVVSLGVFRTKCQYFKSSRTKINKKCSHTVLVIWTNNAFGRKTKETLAGFYKVVSLLDGSPLPILLRWRPIQAIICKLMSCSFSI